jgi:hypothetical protein
MTEQTIIILLILTGIGHIAMSIGSMTVPKLLGWKKHLDSMPPLLRQVFWAYAGFTKMTIIAFGLVSIFGAHELVAPSFLARCINGFIIFYWLIRLGVEFIYYDRSTLTGIAKISDRTLVVLFVIFIFVHGAALLINL